MADLKSYLPWTTTPLIINAPMGGFAGGALASQVSLAGGFGFVGGVFDMKDLRSQLEIASKAFESDPQLSSSKTLPIGVGILPFVLKLDDFLPLVDDFKPAVVWLFAAKHLDDYQDLAARIRTVSPDSKIWIQCGNVAAALHIAKTVKPDALCLQGADAGGHGFEKGAGIISLFPETADALAKEGLGGIPLLAAGGIADGRSVAAALALGAKGVVLGTRFLASNEVMVPPKYQEAILEAHDGGQVTVRSKVFDELRGPNIWPEAYDGRSLTVKSWEDHKSGMSIDEIRRLHNEAAQGADKGYATGLQGRAAIWAGSGVGLVNKVEKAKEIVESLRKDATDILTRIAKV